MFNIIANLFFKLQANNPADLATEGPSDGEATTMTTLGLCGTSALQRQCSVSTTLTAADTKVVCELAIEDAGWELVSSNSDAIVCSLSGKVQSSDDKNMTIVISLTRTSAYETAALMTGYSFETTTIHRAMLRRALEQLARRIEERAAMKSRSSIAGRLALRRAS